MQLADVAEAVWLDQQCFPTAWSASLFRRELTQNHMSAYWVLRNTQNAAHPSIVGYGGYWQMGEDAHITKLAIHPDWRRQGLASWLLFQMLHEMRNQGNCMATLEVRIRNRAAISLYTGLGFVEVGRRPHYYPDTGEDALLLSFAGLDDGSVWRKLKREFSL